MNGRLMETISLRKHGQRVGGFSAVASGQSEELRRLLWLASSLVQSCEQTSRVSS